MQKLTYKFDGYETCPSWLKISFRRAVDFQCQMCKRYEKDVGCLEIHRITRSNRGGLYTIYPLNHKLNNCKVICKSCHKKIHENEFRTIHII